MLEKLFSLDRVTDFPPYVLKDSYQTVLDDKSGNDHLVLSEEGHTYLISSRAVGFFAIFIIIWLENFTVCISFNGPCGVEFSAPLRVPCLLYIDDRQNGRL